MNSIRVVPNVASYLAEAPIRSITPIRLIPIAALFTLAAADPCCAQTINITGETVDGRTITLPQVSAGKHCIIAVAASQKAEPMLEAWLEPVYNRLVLKSGLMVSDVDCDLWLVPVFTGMNKVAYGPMMERLKAEADPDIAQRVVFVKDDNTALLDALGMKNLDEPYFFVLGPDGARKHTEHGAYNVDKLDALEEALEK